MATRIAHPWLALLLIGLLASGAMAQVQAPPAYRAAAMEARVPAVVLFAVALQESGINWRGRLIPWPWTLNVAGKAYRFQTKGEACAALKAALHTLPKTRIDIGLGQINVGYHGHRVDKPCDLLDPYRNLAICASILREHHRESDDWLVAVGRYHRPAGGESAARYRQSVEQHLARLSASRNATSTSDRDAP